MEADTIYAVIGIRALATQNIKKPTQSQITALASLKHLTNINAIQYGLKPVNIDNAHFNKLATQQIHHLIPNPTKDWEVEAMKLWKEALE